MIVDGRRADWRRFAVWTLCAAVGAVAGVLVPAAVLGPACVIVLVGAHVATRGGRDPIPQARRLKP